MGHTRRQGLSYTSLTYVIFYLCLCGSNGKKNGFKIYRSKQDIFTNVHCNGKECTENQCEKYNAKCHKADKCDYCSCLKRKENTFMISERNQTRGKCKHLKDVSPGLGINNSNYSFKVPFQQHTSSKKYDVKGLRGSKSAN